MRKQDPITNSLADEQISYGVSQHYTGEKGRKYQGARRMLPLGEVAQTHLPKFAPYVSKTDTVIDFGCGSGEILSALHCGQRIGVEVNPHAREQAQDKGISCYSDTSELPSGIADVVISHHVLEHVPFPIQALRELRRLLRADGTLVLCLPVDYAKRAKAYSANDVTNHLHTWTAQNLGNTLVEAGFAVRPTDIWYLRRRFPRPLLGLYPYMPATLVSALAYIFAFIRSHQELMAVAKVPAQRTL